MYHLNVTRLITFSFVFKDSLLHELINFTVLKSVGLPLPKETEISHHIFFSVELHAGIGPGAGVDRLPGLSDLHYRHSQHDLQQTADRAQT